MKTEKTEGAATAACIASARSAERRRVVRAASSLIRSSQGDASRLLYALCRWTRPPLLLSPAAFSGNPLKQRYNSVHGGRPTAGWDG